ncbi:hypothetical protein [Polaromonas aquatica]|uniref:hypothetical protein n=1 Tax=Polaromonas aquatica TaxID=332657 RepID=UPI003D662880
MKLEFGAPKALDDISLQDAKDHPIWLWAWEAGLEGEVEDETWQCPVLNTSDGADAMTEPVITLCIEGGDMICSARPATRSLINWKQFPFGRTVPGRESRRPLATPIAFIAVPSIRGVTGVRPACFACLLAAD